jgi:shikimate dehydrogenase
MKTVGLIGWPVEHSLSPRMHQAAFKALRLNWQYVLLPTDDQLEDVIDQLRTAEWAGANVTIPHKSAVMPLLDEVDRRAQSLGAVNTIVKRAGGLIGYNTDVIGFERALLETRIDVGDRPCAVLGAGGSARAIVHVLQRLQARVTVYARDVAKAQWFNAVDWRERTRLDPATSLIVNTTPLGMSPKVGASPWPDDVPFPASALVFDLVYNPKRTRFMEQAERSGARSINGLAMLLYQGAAAFEMWTGCAAPLQAMRAAVQRE